MTEYIIKMDGPRAFHGLKRIWEYLDDIHGKTNSYLHKYINIQAVIDTKLIAFLLDPDSGERVLTISYLSERYLGDVYPYNIICIYEQTNESTIPKLLTHDARVIFRLAEELTPKYGS